jgi:hypothetical protein
MTAVCIEASVVGAPALIRASLGSWGPPSE